MAVLFLLLLLGGPPQAAAGKEQEGGLCKAATSPQGPGAGIRLTKVDFPQLTSPISNTGIDPETLRTQVMCSFL